MDDSPSTAPTSVSATPLTLADRAKLWGVPQGEMIAIAKQSLAQRVRSAIGDGDSVIAVLTEILANGRDDRDRLRAAEMLLDRAYGKSIAPTVDLTQAANKIAAAYGVDPDELASLSNSIWNASTTTAQHEELPQLPPLTSS